MQRRRLTVAVVLCVLLAGCLGAGQPPAGTTDAEPTGTTTAAVDYPEPPESRSNASVLAFAESYERALATERARAAADGEIQRLTVTVTNATVVEDAPNGTVVHLEYSVGLRVESYSGKVSAADTRYTANYYATQDRVYRAGTDGLRRPGPDPKTNGTVVAPN